jgi:hypothetical protein
LPRWRALLPGKGGILHPSERRPYTIALPPPPPLPVQRVRFARVHVSCRGSWSLLLLALLSLVVWRPQCWWSTKPGSGISSWAAWTCTWSRSVNRGKIRYQG